MRSTGFGAFIYEICIHVPIHQASRLTDALQIEPYDVDEAGGSASFIVQMQNRKQGDDETVVWMLMHMIPKGIDYSIDWERSVY